MTKKEQIQLFESKQVRTVWDDEQEKWYFSVVDVVSVLTDSTDPKQYVKKMKSRDPELNSNWGTICTLVHMKGLDGKNREQMAADMVGVFRIIQSIPSPKAEPFKQWMAQVASFPEHAQAATDGGNIARNARLELEEQTGKAVVTPLNAKKILQERKEQ